MLRPLLLTAPRRGLGRHHEAVRRGIEDNVARYVDASPEQIERRLAELDREWDVDRILEAKSAGLILAGLGLGALADRRYLALPAVVATFQLQHALLGWSPPAALLRRLGVRTAVEIDQERYALKALRGDFRGVTRRAKDDQVRIERVLKATEV
jgi:hypothetical protein